MVTRFLSQWLVAFIFIASFGPSGDVQATLSFGTPVNLGSTINSAGYDSTPSLSDDGLTMYFFSERSGGEGGWDIWTATRATVSSPWGTPSNPGTPLNTSDNQSSPSISSDGLSLFFSQGIGNEDIWVSTRATTSDPWGTPSNLGAVVNSTALDADPEISSDGLTLIFGSERSGGIGGRDLWMATRSTSLDPWGTPVNLGPTVNSSGLDEGASLSSDGLKLFFMSNRDNLSAPFDLWMTTRESLFDSWGAPAKLPSPINSSFADTAPEISADGSTLFFASTRPGGSGSLDLYMVAIVPEPSTYALAAFGLIGLGLYGWRRKGILGRPIQQAGVIQ